MKKVGYRVANATALSPANRIFCVTRAHWLILSCVLTLYLFGLTLMGGTRAIIRYVQLIFHWSMSVDNRLMFNCLLLGPDENILITGFNFHSHI